MKLVLTIFIILTFGFVNAQVLYSDWTSSNDGNLQSIELQGNLNYQSNVLNNDLTSKFLFGGNINSEIITTNESNIGSTNVVGLETVGSLKYINARDSLFKSGKWGYYVKFEHERFVNLSFHRDLFHAVFIGNADKIGEKLSIGPTQLNNLTFQELGFGIIHKKTKSEIGINLVKGQSFQKFDIESGYLLTATDVSNIEVQVKGDLMRADTLGNQIGTLNGIGASINGQWNLSMNWNEKERGILKIKVDNLGVVSWNRNTSTTKIDTNFQFKGIEIDNILNSSVSSSQNLNSAIDSLIPADNNSPFYTIMPIILSITKEPISGKIKKFQSIAGVRHIFNMNYKPLIYAGAYYRFNEKVAASTLLMYGGYGNLNVGLRGNFNVSNKIAFYIASQNTIGSFSKMGKGFNLNLGLQCKF